MPMPRLTTALASSSSAARRAMILRSPISRGCSVLMGTRISPAKRGGVELGEGLHVILAPLGDHHAIDHNAGNLDLPRVQAATFGDALDLHDDPPAGIVSCHSYGKRFQSERLALHRDVAIGISCGAAHDGNVDRESAVEKILCPVELHQADEVGGCAGVELAAAVPWIGKRVEPDLASGGRVCRQRCLGRDG